jgi:Zn-dependent protease/CBS domain-containing protein
LDTDIRLGRIAGIPVGMNWSLLLIFALITWSLAAGVLPAEVRGQPGVLYWAVGLVIALLFFASIVTHELAHAIVARRSGQHVSEITLWLFGGVSKLGGDAGTPAIEATVAIVGPLTSLSVAVVVALVGLAVGAAGAPAILVAGLYWLAGINVALGLFNLVPGFPLDGGRLLRALLWRWRGDRVRATSQAAAVGRFFGFALAALGLLEFFVSSDLIGGLWLVFLGWFLRSAAGAEETQVMKTQALSGVRVADLMTPNPVVLPGSISVQEFLWTGPSQHRFTTFPVTSADGNVVGLVSLRRLLQVPEAARRETVLSDIVDPLSNVATARPSDPVTEVLSHMGPAGEGRVLVFDGDRLAGIVSPRDIAGAIPILRARAGSRRPAPPFPGRLD